MLERGDMRKMQPVTAGFEEEGATSQGVQLQKLEKARNWLLKVIFNQI